MSIIRIWVHLVFSTKNREPRLKEGIKPQIINHIMQNCKEKGIFLQAINGYSDHLHCLISLGSNQSIATISQLLKGESSYWINKNHLTFHPFVWQDDYYAVSVSESSLADTVSYIHNQVEHHKKLSFDEELTLLFEKIKAASKS